ncbi:hypothetical protein RND61_23980 [Streptomyces sp. TRM76323]|uniref:Uncharacterized protein n=1 Tax=Streptomyces tamarix TaxID=3078565 RepID=A0ABU3QQQ7_9ACTN|nr:hypothetical protein [Streptomyces tamarix]MDT9685094.1 hypothetical protein [Streptomyces tamarix]
MGDFVFIPASPLSGGDDGKLWNTDEAIPLTWSAPLLEEFVTAMERIERDFSCSWKKVDLSAGSADPAAGKRAGLHEHA